MKLTPSKNLPLVKINEKFQVTIPLSIRQTFNLEAGDILEAITEGKKIVLKPNALSNKLTDIAIQEGLEDYRKGRVKGPFRNVSEFKSSLKR